MTNIGGPLLYNVRVGAHPICWCNDDMHDLGDEYSFEQIIDEMAMAGYAGTELGRKYPRDSKALRAALRRRGLVLTSAWSDIMFAADDIAEKYYESFKEQARFLADMGCRQVIVAEGGGSTCWDPREDRRKLGVKKLDDEGFKKLADGLNRCGDFTKNLGMQCVLHVHTGTVVETAEETEKVLNLTDADKVFILADTGHLHYCNVDVPGFFSAFADRIKYVHLKDIRQDVLNMVRQFGLDFNSSVRVGVFTVPGDGCIDYKAVFRILAEKEYQGWMVVEAEQNPAYANPLRYATMARKYIRELTGV